MVYVMSAAVLIATVWVRGVIVLHRNKLKPVGVGQHAYML